ncbi:hypothetical protein PWT90_04594 [Aphanocladium album]|nr:hypothetical protein PWT90_04594 [Aphanocladium album]
MGQHIRQINSSIRGDPQAYSVEKGLHGIASLLAYDLVGHLPTWRAHIRGYIALVQHLGGPKAVWKLPKPAPSSFWIVLPIAVETNTLCPAIQQIRGLDDFEDEDLATIYDYELAAELPYPTGLFLAMFHISRLRHQIASGEVSDPQLLKHMVAEIMGRIDSFNHAIWLGEKEEEAKDLDILAAVAHVCQAAIRLYGILTLPTAAVVSWATSQSYPVVPGLDSYQSLRTVQGKELMKQLRDIWPTVTFKAGLTWSLTVAGVAVSDGAAADREFVSLRLLDIWLGSEAGYSLEHDCRLKLHKMWLHGKTEWEECFDEPVPLVRYM